MQEAACGLLGTLSLMEHSPEKLRSVRLCFFMTLKPRVE